MPRQKGGRHCGCEHATESPVYTGDDTASIHEPSAPVYTGDDLASIYGEESAPYNSLGRYSGGGKDYGDDDDGSLRGSSLDDRDDRPLEKGDEKGKKKYMMTKPQRKYMTRNSAGCLVATLCIAMLILVLTTIALFIWLFIFQLASNNDYVGYCPAVRDDQGGICVQECNNNGECEGRQLCCSNGCGHVCVDPAPVVINLNLTLNQSYDEAYRDEMSTQYRLLQRDYINIVNEIISNDDKLDKYHLETTVSAILPGSVKIVSWLTFDIDVGNTVDIADELQGQIAAIISKEAEDGRLGRLQGDVIDVTVSKPLDPADTPIRPPPPPRPTGDGRPEDPLGTGICGTRPGAGRPQTRIVGGAEVEIESAPWVGSLWNDDGDYIGALTLLNQQWAITAANLVIKSPLYAVFGLKDLKDHSNGDRRDGIPISVFIPHPGAQYGGISHDIALVRLSRPVTFSNQIRPACFGTSMEEPTAYRTCRTVGFGGEFVYDFSSSGGDNYYQLRQADDVPVHSTKECQDAYAAYDFNSQLGFYEIDYNHICAGDLDNGDGNACWGDFGVPLTCLGDDDLWHLVGVSVLISCDTPNFPTAYSRISTYKDFILDAITSTEMCLGFNTQECTYQCAGGIDCVPKRCADPGLFQCTLGPCIPTRAVCDGEYDCFDNSDEAICSICGDEYIVLEGDQPYQLSYPVYAPFAPVGAEDCHWIVSVYDDRRIQLSFVDMAIVPRDLLTVNTGDRILYFDGADDDLSDVYSAAYSIEVTFQITSPNTQSTFRLQFRAHESGSEYCSYDEFQCSYTSLFCIDIDHVCDGESNCPYGDDEQDCPDECGDEYIHLYPGDAYQLTSVNWPGLYPENSYCHWVIQSEPGRQLVLHFTNFALQNDDYLVINLDGAAYLDGGVQPRQAGGAGGQTSPIGNLFQNHVNLTGYEVPRDLLSKGHAVAISMVTNGYSVEDGGIYGFVLDIRDTDGTDVAACSNGYVIPPYQVCNNAVDCPDNSDEAPCQCGDIPREVYLHSSDAVTLTSYKYPFHHYTNSLNCHWMFTASAGYRVLVHFNVFDLEENFDFLTITGTNHFYPSVAYTGNTLPPDIESPSNFLFIWFETDEKNGAVGFQLTVSVAQAAGRQKCDNQLELLPDNDLHGICDGIQHCYDGSDEKEECKCTEEDEFYMRPDDEAIVLASANYPRNYLPESYCEYTIVTYAGYHLLAHFIDLHVEYFLDFVQIGASDDNKFVSYTGSMSHYKRALDALSVGNTMHVKFYSDLTVQDIGYKLQISVVSGNYADGRNFCDNKVQILPEEFVCDMILDCDDYSDEETCVDIFDTGICGTRPAVDDRILYGEDAVQGELPWMGYLNLGTTSCGATLINEYWAVTAAHCLEAIEVEEDNIRLVFGDRMNEDPSSPHRQEVELGMYFIDQDYSITGVKYDFALIRFKLPVKFTDHVRPACIAATKDEVNFYKQCKVAGWGTAIGDDGGSSYSFDPSILQTEDVQIVPLDQCGEYWESASSYSFSSAGWENPDSPLICAGTYDPDNMFADICNGDSGGGLTCLGDDDRWHLVGVVNNGPVRCVSRPNIYARVSLYRVVIAHLIGFTEKCLAGEEPPECYNYLECNGGPDCILRECTEEEFKCNDGRCIPADRLCDGNYDCYDYSDEDVPNCYADCGRSEISISEYQTYIITSPNYPSFYPPQHICLWTVTSPPYTRIFAEFTNVDLEDGYDYVSVGFDPGYKDFGAQTDRFAPHFVTGVELSSFVSPENVLYVNLYSDAYVTLQGFVLKFQVFTQYSDIPPLCGDNFQVYGGEAVVCDGVNDCIDGTDESVCVCPAVEELYIEPQSYLFLSSPTGPSGKYYPNSLSCTWRVKSSHYILTSVDYLYLDERYTDSLQISSGTGVEGIFTYGADSPVYGFLLFESNEVVIRFSTDAYWNNGDGFEITLYDTNGDDCMISSDPYCAQRPGCNDDCYVKMCSSGTEYYEASLFCDGDQDCRDGSDEPKYCECGERDVHIGAELSYELSPPPSLLLPGTYRLDSDCQWTFTTSEGFVLYAHFDYFKIEDGNRYIAYDDDLLYGDYLYAGVGSSPINYKNVKYTGSDVPLDLETPSNRLVLTFLSDETIAYEGFSVTIYSRRAAAQMKCQNGLEIYTKLLECDGNQDCYGEPTDEAHCP